MVENSCSVLGNQDPLDPARRLRGTKSTAGSSHYTQRDGHSPSSRSNFTNGKCKRSQSEWFSPEGRPGSWLLHLGPSLPAHVKWLCLWGGQTGFVWGCEAIVNSSLERGKGISLQTKRRRGPSTHVHDLNPLPHEWFIIMRRFKPFLFGEDTGLYQSVGYWFLYTQADLGWLPKTSGHPVYGWGTRPNLAGK